MNTSKKFKTTRPRGFDINKVITTLRLDGALTLQEAIHENYPNMDEDHMLEKDDEVLYKELFLCSKCECWLEHEHEGGMDENFEDCCANCYLDDGDEDDEDYEED